MHRLVPMAKPTLLWRFRRSDGTTAHCVLVPSWPRHTLIWFVSQQVEGAEDFNEWEDALMRAEEVRELLIQQR